jgi:hypothetical protein
MIPRSVSACSAMLAVVALHIANLPLAEAASASSTIVPAYIGPGAGLGMIGSLLAVAAAVLLGLFGLVFYPVRLILRACRKRAESPKPESTTAQAVAQK